LSQTQLNSDFSNVYPQNYQLTAFLAMPSPQYLKKTYSLYSLPGDYAFSLIEKDSGHCSVTAIIYMNLTQLHLIKFSHSYYGIDV